MQFSGASSAGLSVSPDGHGSVFVGAMFQPEQAQLEQAQAKIEAIGRISICPRRRTPALPKTKIGNLEDDLAILLGLSTSTSNRYSV